MIWVGAVEVEGVGVVTRMLRGMMARRMERKCTRRTGDGTCKQCVGLYGMKSAWKGQRDVEMLQPGQRQQKEADAKATGDI
jgi:hypothetical protein